MITDEAIKKVMTETGLSEDEYFMRRLAVSEVVATAAELNVIDSGLGLWPVGTGEAFLVTLDMNGVRLASDVLDARMLEWAGFRGSGAVRGILMLAEREGRALRDRLTARYHTNPF
jgi:hypothetical protein